MGIRLSDAAQRYIAAFATATGVTPTDCLVEESITFVVPPDKMATAIGPNGRMVKQLEAEFGREVVIVADDSDPARFVANALTPAAVVAVRIEERDDERIANAAVDPDDVGVAIGPDGSRIERARRLADRHHDIDDVTVESAR